MEKIVAEITFKTREPIEEIDAFAWCGCGAYAVITKEGKKIEFNWTNDDIDSIQDGGCFGFTTQLSGFDERYIEESNDGIKLTVKELTSLQLVKADYSCYIEDSEDPESEGDELS